VTVIATDPTVPSVPAYVATVNVVADPITHLVGTVQVT
jgi:hypothetical protein